MNQYIRNLFAFCFLIAASADAKPPNIVVVLTDDLGYSDLGCYGAEIETPTLDRLAENGLRFSQFYNTAKCHSSRVSLLSGQYCRQAGDESMRHAVTMPEVLYEAGYFTTMVGKWHLEKEPTDYGFQRYWGHLSGATHFFQGDKTFRLNGEKWEVPKKGFYTTIANIDFALEFVDEARQTEKPWLLYVAFNAPHAPLHALEQDYKKYQGRYDAGWDVIRDARMAKQKELGLFDKDLKPSPRPDHIPAWQELSKETRDWEIRRMTTLAAMIDRVDQELGRLVKDLEDNGDLDNTLILFLSDNGACPYDRHNIRPDLNPWDSRTRWTDSTGWAWARNAPFRYYKQNQFEGGIATPAVLHWPKGLKTKPGEIVDYPVHLVDLLPTFIDLAGTQRPDTWPDRDLRPMAGVSLRSILEGKGMDSRPPIHFLHHVDRGLRDQDWKLVSFRSKKWELYDMGKDRTELNDVADQHPEIVERMSKEWHRMAKDVLMAPEGERTPVSDEVPPHQHREWTRFNKK